MYYNDSPVTERGAMPVSRLRDPFRAAPATSLRLPEARVLAVLQPTSPADPVTSWPLLTRARLSTSAGYTETSGTVTRALNGSHKRGHPGLLALGLVVEEVLDIDGVSEVNYLATAAGVAAYRAYAAAHGGEMPEVKDAATCVNTTRGYNNPHKEKP